MKSFYFSVKNGTYRLNFGIENGALKSRGDDEIAWSDHRPHKIAIADIANQQNRDQGQDEA